ncbi:hypothetical protein EUTSA_v10001181mg [Eutrema salsugineum]|uniref:Uncharacterized protein n=1 Tax=Eutrema salsugineum TaxID=72664 RepID=V4N317_EUTSA|nr:hypothetical protein EUTSA_v10001181mg [Eutrema salsugineum]
MAMTTQHMNLIFLVLLLISFAISPVISTVPKECETDATDSCIDKTKALPLKIIAIVAILVTSMIGVMAPLFSRYVPFLSPDGKIFMIVKCFASGIILGTGFMHVLPDSFEMLSSPCLEDDPWHKFPFTGFVAMFLYTKKAVHDDGEEKTTPMIIQIDHLPITTNKERSSTCSKQLMRYRVIAMVLELGIIVHSVVIGLSLGATNDTCTIKGLIAALCFHQMFEGMGLGGCILQLVLLFQELFFRIQKVHQNEIYDKDFHLKIKRNLQQRPGGQLPKLNGSKSLYASKALTISVHVIQKRQFDVSFYPTRNSASIYKEKYPKIT